MWPLISIATFLFLIGIYTNCLLFFLNTTCLSNYYKAMTNLNEHQIKAMTEYADRMRRYDELKNKADSLNRDKIDELIDFVNKILLQNNIKDFITKNQIQFDAYHIGNVFMEDKKLSQLIFEKIFPKPTMEVYSHYTTFEGAKGIISNKELWIFNLLKNFNDEEFRLFYEEHNIKGYRDLKTTLGVKTDYRSLMAEQFSLCLTSEENSSTELWDYFGYGGTGIKLTFEIDSKIPDFREVYYSDKNNPKQISLLSELFNSIFDKYGTPFNFSYISKIGAFYIHGKFSNEREYRFLVKRTADDYNARNFIPKPFQDDISYIVVPFNSSLGDFKLKKVSKGPNCSASNFSIIKQIIYSGYPTGSIDIEE